MNLRSQLSFVHECATAQLIQNDIMEYINCFKSIQNYQFHKLDPIYPHSPPPLFKNIAHISYTALNIFLMKMLISVFYTTRNGIIKFKNLSFYGSYCIEKLRYVSLQYFFLKFTQHFEYY